MNNCPLCGDDRYASLSVFCKSGHLSMCKRKQQKQYIENEFNKKVIAPIIEASKKGPILYAVGVGEAMIIKKFIPVMYRYICKYQLIHLS